MAARFDGSIKRNLSCQCGLIKARNSREINFFRSCSDKRLYCIGLWNIPFDGSTQSAPPQHHLHAWKVCNSTSL